MIRDRLKELQDLIDSSKTLSTTEKKNLEESVSLLIKEAEGVMLTEKSKEAGNLFDFFRHLEASHPAITKALDGICQSLSGAGI